MVQGYYFSRPMPVAEADIYLRDNLAPRLQRNATGE